MSKCCCLELGTGARIIGWLNLFGAIGFVSLFAYWVIDGKITTIDIFSLIWLTVSIIYISASIAL